MKDEESPSSSGLAMVESKEPLFFLVSSQRKESGGERKEKGRRKEKRGHTGQR